MKTNSFLLLTLLCLAACVREEAPSLPDGEDLQEYNLSLTAPAPATRSEVFSIYGVDENAIGACKAAVYLGGVKLREIESEDGNLSLGKLNNSAKYSFYAVTGAATDGFTFPDEESSLSSMKVNFKTASSTFSQFMGAWRTIPMIAQAKEVSPVTLDAQDGSSDRKLTLEAERLFAKVNLTVTADDKILELCPTQTLSSLRIKRVAAESPLFGNAVNWNSVAIWSAGDRETQGLSFGQTYTLYLPENLQGVIGSDNLLPSRKSEDILSGILSAGRLSKLTYIETEVQYAIGNANAGDGGTVTYRFYPGGNDCNDFNIRRNTVYNITLSLTYDNMFSGGDWKISTEDVIDSRSLAFTSASTIHAPGKKTYFAASYQDAYTQSNPNLHPQFSYMYRSQNGYVFGTKAETDAFVRNRGQLLPPEYPTVIGGYLQCARCGTFFPGFPSGARDRETFVKSQAWADDTGIPWSGSTTDQINYCCPVCSVKWCSNGTSSQDPDSYSVLSQIKTALTETTAGNLKAIPGQTVFVEVKVPASASSGDVFSYYVCTADDRLWDRRDVVVADAGMVLDKNDLYLAQKTQLRAVRVPSSVTSLTFLVTSGNNVVRLKDATSYGCTVEGMGIGTATLVCKDQNGNQVSTRTVTVKPPVLKLNPGSAALSADGTASTAILSLCDESGKELVMDSGLREEIIVPNLSATFTGDSGGYLDGGLMQSTAGSPSRFHLKAFVKNWNGLNLNGGGTSLKTGLSLAVTLSNPSGNLSKTLSLSIRNPFKGWPDTPYTMAVYYQRPDIGIPGESNCHPLGLMDASTGTQLMAPGQQYAISSYGFSQVDGKMVHTASGAVLTKEVTSCCRMDVVFNDDVPALICLPETELPVSVPGTLALSHTVTNAHSGESQKRYLAQFPVSERIEPIVRFEHKKWRYFIGLGYHQWRIFLNFDIIGAGLPFSPENFFDCTVDGVKLSPAGEYPDWKYYDAQNHLVTTSASGAEAAGAVKGLAGQEATKVDAFSYELEVYQELKGHKYMWSVVDYFEWNASNLLFHRRGQSSVRAFDLYFNPDGTSTGYQPAAAPVYWLHYDQKYVSQGFTDQEIWGE